MKTGLFPVAGIASTLALALGAPTAAFAVDYWLRAEPLVMTFAGSANPVRMWGYAKCTDGSFTTCDPATVPGPALTVPAGDAALTIHLKNALPANALFDNSTSIVIPGQTASMSPVKFTDGAGRERVRAFTHETALGAVGVYSWTAMKPGTYLYHSGSHPQIQVQMGLYGSLRKDVASGEAYPGVVYDQEVTLLYSEVDPALHAQVSDDLYDPATNSTLHYQPRHFLINGKPYEPGDPALATLSAGQPTLLRFLNAGLRTHVPTLNGLVMKMIAEDGNPYPWPTHPREQYSVLLPAAKTIDAVIVPRAADGSAARYPVYDRMLALSNDGLPDGGMLAFLDVGASGSAPVFTSTPVTTATQGVPYAYTLTADDADGDALTFALDVKPAGMGVDAASGQISWTPGAVQVGTQFVSARVTDSTGMFATQSFSVQVADVNDAPTAQNDAYAMIVGGTLSVAAPGVLGNDSDPDAGDALTAMNFSTPSSGTLTPNANGSFSFTAGTTGTKTFTYQARDNSNVLSNVATVSIAVSANRPPVAVDDTFSAPVRRLSPPYVARTLVVLTNDSDPDTVIDPTNVINPGTVVISTAPNKGGSATVNANGTISYVPKLNFRGTEVFKYRVRDTLNGLSNAATVRVNIN